jgi:hypothetical protein
MNFAAEAILLFAGCVISETYILKMNSIVKIPIETNSNFLNMTLSGSDNPVRVSNPIATTFKIMSTIIK